MTSSPTARRRSGFTLIELLTVIAIIGILAAILIPTVAKVQETARRTSDASAIRQVAQSALIFANDNQGRLPGTNQTALNNVGEIVATGGSTGGAVTIHQYAAALARQGGLNDAAIWISNSDQAALALNNPLTTVLATTAPASTYAANFATAALSYVPVSGLTTNRPSTTPVVFTRGLQTSGLWAASGPTAAGGVYGENGGHIAFLGGNVSFFSNLTGSVKLAAIGGAQTSNILDTLLTSEAVVTYSGAPLSALAGTGGGSGGGAP